MDNTKTKGRRKKYKTQRQVPKVQGIQTYGSLINLPEEEDQAASGDDDDEDDDMMAAMVSERGNPGIAMSFLN